jgi:hypothetical protein
MKLPFPRSPRGALLTILAVLAAGAALMSTAVASPDRSSHSSPRLSLIRLSPATVAGHGFRHRVRVRVRLMRARTLSRATVTNGAGAFTLTFPTVVDRCSAWSVTATAAHQAAVVLRSPAKPACAPARTP